MLIRFVASNFLSLGKECEFNMLAAPLKSHTDHVYYNQTKRLKVLKGAAIYGANGAGKSNIVKAIYFLRDTILAGSIPRKFPSINTNSTKRFPGSRQHLTLNMNGTRSSMLIT